MKKVAGSNMVVINIDELSKLSTHFFMKGFTLCIDELNRMVHKENTPIFNDEISIKDVDNALTILQLAKPQIESTMLKSIKEQLENE